MLDAIDDRPGLFRRLLASLRIFERSSVWSSHIAWREVPLVGGGRAKGNLMRRFANGRWQYRALTEDEQEQQVIDRTW